MRMALYVDWNNYIADNPTVTHRIPGQEAYESPWSTSTDNEATFMPSGMVGKTVAELVKASGDYFVRTIPYGENPQTARFSLAGSRNALTQVMTACRIDPTEQVAILTRCDTNQDGTIMCDEAQACNIPLSVGPAHPAYAYGHRGKGFRHCR